MREWEEALERYLPRWRRRREVVGALVCGSFVTGSPTPRSDIDLHILLKASTKWRERGNDIVDGCLIEYFANPPGSVRRYFAERYADNRHTAATQFVTGRILFDDIGVVAQLKAEGRRWLAKRYKRPRHAETLRLKYGLWDQLDSFADAVECGEPDVAFQYAHCLYGLVRTYARYLGDNVPSPLKAYRALATGELTRKYLQRPFSDPAFGKRCARAMLLTDRSKMVRTLEKLTRYVHERMDGFEIDGFRMRSKA